MSSESHPITPQAFALALKDLDMPIIHGKVSEIRNSLGHLQRSNEEMKSYIEEGDDGREIFQEAIAENVVVMERMKERIELCRSEIERRGGKWIDEADSSGNTAGQTDQTGTDTSAAAATTTTTTEVNGIANVEQSRETNGAEEERARAQPNGHQASTSSATDTTAPDRGVDNDAEDGVYL